MITWHCDLVNDIARRKCILYLGSGVSANSLSSNGVDRPATWDQFLRKVLAKCSSELAVLEACIVNLLDKQDYLMACEIIVNIIGEVAFGELCADAYRRPGFLVNTIHEVIYGLDSRIVITPNIDKKYEQCANRNSNSTVVIKKYYEDIAPFLRQSDYLIIKAHGCVDDPQHIVFTHGQYNWARYKHAPFYRIMDALLLTNTFIFLGCGISDPDIQLTLENTHFSFPNCKPHYFVTAKGSIDDEVAKSLLKNRNIKVLTYDNENGNHAELLFDLQKLAPLVDESRHDLSKSEIW